jgi:asparagine synthase (glutamine-hydrolysing)
MCGIAGVYAPEAHPDVSAIDLMLTSMAHRGPDDRGVQVLANGHLVLGHLRLSILDLSPLGHQPMATPDGRTWIVYNGEIYNFKEIRAQLQGLGDSFRSDSDTEVILAAYRRWGLAAIDRFRGMFAFALWDDLEKVLHLCRDRFGVKPLYFSLYDGRVAFASEMKGLISAQQTARHVDPKAVAEFVQYGYVSAPTSIFSDVRTVRPGTICTINLNLEVVEREYWGTHELFDGDRADSLRREIASLTEPELLERTEALLEKAFAYRMVADVPVGMFLSGGIDSSLVATLLTRRAGFRLKTFTIGFGDSEFNESMYARRVAQTLETEHTEFNVSAEDVLSLYGQIIDIADEPIGDSSLLPTLMVSKLARQHVKVALSADGADELFGGYARYAVCGNFIDSPRAVRGMYYLSAAVLDALPPQVVARAYRIAKRGGAGFAAINDKLRKFVRMAQARDEFAAYEATVSEWSVKQARNFVVAPATTSSASTAYKRARGILPRDRFMHFDMARYLPGDLLVKVDRASMAVSLEAREPFLDHELASLAAALPIRWKIRGSENKYLLRKLLLRYFPASLFKRPKQGFSPPIGDWLRGPLRETLRDELSNSRVTDGGILDPRSVTAAVDDFLIGNRRSGSAAGIWILLQLQQWAARWQRSDSSTKTSSADVGLQKKSLLTDYRVA